MSGPLRSRQGCWTCKLRKKKCDESRPRCTVCESLSITCYGFGPKPQWMDGGAAERAVASSLQEIVKHTSRRRGAAAVKQTDKITMIAPKPISHSSDNSSSDPGSIRPESSTVSTPPSANWPLEEGFQHLDVKAAMETECKSTFTSINLPADDAVLLMHFINTVFVSQFPMYKPTIYEGGLGWLLAMLLRTPSFYQSALALATYHRRTVTCEKISVATQVSTLVQQETHSGNAIKLVNELAQNSCPRNGIGVLLSVLHLGLYELFNGDNDTWKTHICAVLRIHERGLNEDAARYGLADEAWKIVTQDRPVTEHDPALMEYVTAFRFMDATIKWIDVISSMTTGILPSHVPRIVAYGSQTELGAVMGCKNWAMLQIGRIAILHARKNQAMQLDNNDMPEFEQTAESIKLALHQGLGAETLHLAFQKTYALETCSDAAVDCNNHDRSHVTAIFASMAQVYLHLVTRGFAELDLLDQVISEMIQSLLNHTPIHLLPALIAPIFIVGCVARENWEQEFFITKFASPPISDIFFKHRQRILPALQKIWNMRRTVPTPSWQDALEHTGDILLL